jgi:hypothetical protein
MRAWCARCGGANRHMRQGAPRHALGSKLELSKALKGPRAVEEKEFGSGNLTRSRKKCLTLHVETQRTQEKISA